MIGKRLEYALRTVLLLCPLVLDYGRLNTTVTHYHLDLEVQLTSVDISATRYIDVFDLTSKKNSSHYFDNFGMF